MELSDYTRLLRKSWPILVVLLLLGVLGGAGAKIVQPQRFSATAQVYVSVASTGNLGDLSTATTLAHQIASDYVDIATTHLVLQPVVTRLHLPMTAATLSHQITVSAGVDSPVVNIAATSASPRQAAAIANAVADRLSQSVRQFTPALRKSKATVTLLPVNPAEVPTAPVTPSLLIYLLVGALAGLLVGLTVAVIRETLDTKVRTAQDVERVTAAPIIGTTYRFRPRSGPVVVTEGALGPVVEAFRSVRNNLRFVDVGSTRRALVITSSVPGEGKSTTAVNIALALADVKEQVVLVDADLRRPKLHDYLGLPGAPGLTDVISGSVTLDDALQSWGDRGLVVLPAGETPPNPNELLQSQAMKELLDELGRRFTTVLLDTPPLVPVSDAAVLAHYATGAIVVAAVGRVRRPELHRSLGVLNQTEAPVLGVILSQAPTGPMAPYGYGPVYAAKPARGSSRRIASERRQLGDELPGI